MPSTEAVCLEDTGFVPVGANAVSASAVVKKQRDSCMIEQHRLLTITTGHNCGVIHDQKLLIAVKRLGCLYRKLDSTSTVVSVSSSVFKAEDGLARTLC